jgi:site-specific DNA recombinase
LTVIESEAEVVREIFTRCANGETLDEIAARLNERGIAPKRNQTWRRGALHSLIHNPLYCGYVVWDGILKKGKHHAIVSVSESSAAQEALAVRCRGRRAVKLNIVPEEATPIA